MYELWVGLGVMSFGGWVSMVCGKVFSGPAGVQPNALGGRNNCLQQSDCGSKLPPWKSWFSYMEELNAGSKAVPIGRYVTVSQRAKLSNWIL